MSSPTPKAPLTAAERQQRRRQKGKVVSGVLTDVDAIRVLAQLQAKGFTCMHAIEMGLRALGGAAHLTSKKPQSRKAS